MAAFSSTAFDTNAFSTGAFDFGVTVVIDTHDDGRDEYNRKIKEARERLREQIRLAVESPQAQAVVSALESIAIPQRTDSLFVPLAERVDMDKFFAEVALQQRLDRVAALRAQQIDDEEAMLLL